MQIYRAGRGDNPFIAKDFLRDLRGGKALFSTSSRAKSRLQGD
jgi:hypothetical protein